MRDVSEIKAAQRRRAYVARRQQPEKDAISRSIIDRLLQLPGYQQAATVLWYLDCRSELRTRHAIPNELLAGKRIAVPYCTVDARGENQLGLCRLQSMDELVVGRWQILEPPSALWSESSRDVKPIELDCVIVPGVAFSRDGRRLGNGYGYYDRLLWQVRTDCHLIAPAFESQLFDDLVVERHDIRMHKIISERAVYECR